MTQPLFASPRLGYTAGAIGNTTRDRWPASCQIVCSAGRPPVAQAGSSSVFQFRSQRGKLLLVTRSSTHSRELPRRMRLIRNLRHVSGLKHIAARYGHLRMTALASFQGRSTSPPDMSISGKQPGCTGRRGRDGRENAAQAGDVGRLDMHKPGRRSIETVVTHDSRRVKGGMGLRGRSGAGQEAIDRRRRSCYNRFIP